LTSILLSAGPKSAAFYRPLPALMKRYSLPSWPQAAPHLALLTVALIYGLNYTVAKDVMPTYLQPRGFILLRALGGVLLFHLVALFYPRERIQRRDWWRLVVGGFFGVAANQLLFFLGLNLTQPIQAAVIMTTNPIMVLALSAIFLKVPVRILRVLGIVLGLIGATVLITRGTPIGELVNEGQSLGNFLVFLNAACFATYLIITKPIMARYRPVTVTRWAFLFGLIFVAPLGAGELVSVDWPALPPPVIGAISFVVLGTTFLAYLLNMYALRRVSSTTVSFYIYLQPVFATAVAVSLGKDELTGLAVGAALLIFTGVFLVSRPQR